jgi:hypothetical protein
MATSQYNYHPFHTIGAASVLLWDGAAGGGAGAWRPLGKVADAAISVATEQAGQDITVKGLTQPITRRNRSKRYSLSFRLLENAGPEAHALMFGEGNAQSAAAAEITEFSEAFRLYGSQWRELSHPYGIVAEPLPSAPAGHVTAGGTGGSIPAGIYYFWLVPEYLDSTQLLARGEALALGSASITTGQQLNITFDLPDELKVVRYFIFYSATNQLASSRLAGVLTGEQGALKTFSDTPSYSPPVIPLVRAFRQSGQAEFTLGTDYLIDATKGLIKRVAGGAIGDGEEVCLTYAYARPASVETPLGDAVALERYRRVKLLQLTADDPHPALWRETGVEFTFFKVNVNLGDTRWPFSENDFSEGCSVAWDCLFDGEEAKVGTVRGTYGVLAEYA